MKTCFRAVIILMSIMVSLNLMAVKPPSGMLALHVVVSAKSYWDGPSKSCIPREKGGCCHIWVDGMEPGPGEISGEMVVLRDKVIQFTVSRGKGMNNETYRNVFNGGSFTLEGPVTFDPKVLSGLGLDVSYSIPAGRYPYAVNGDRLTIMFR
ncbi:MAG: hypothetical protein ACOYNC_02415 [Bacteroidales bacterium]